MNQSKTLFLSDMSTEELLNALRVYPYEYYEPDDVPHKIYVGSRLVKGGERVEVWGTRSEIRGALVGREHVPNRKEGKLLRRLRAQTGMTEEQLRAHPRFGQQLVDVQQSVPRQVISKKQAPWYQKVYGSLFGKRFKVKG